MPHDRTRQGTLSNAQTYEARYGEKRSVKDIAVAEGVSAPAIHARLAAERERRQAAGKLVHRSRRGPAPLPKRRVRGKLVAVRPEPPSPPAVPTTSEVLEAFQGALMAFLTELTQSCARQIDQSRRSTHAQA